MVHRLLSIYLEGGDSQDQGFYEAQSVHASEREIIATDAERASVKYKLVEFMQDKIGMEFDAHVSGVTEWGMYAEIEPTKVEGMIPLRTIHSDFFEFDEKNYRLVGRRTRKVFTLGDPVRIRVKSANLDQVLLDYELVEPEHETEEQDGVPSVPPVPPPPRRPASRKQSAKRTTKKK
jgi:ribonuclease R